MTRPPTTPRSCCAAARGRAVTVWRCLLVLYLLSLGMPVLQGMLAKAASAGTVLVELCTADGIKRVALDRDGAPVAPDRSDHAAFHHCGACLIGPAKPGLQGGTVTLEPPAAAGVLVGAVHVPPARPITPAAGAPLPPRGPPRAA